MEVQRIGLAFLGVRWARAESLRRDIPRESYLVQFDVKSNIFCRSGDAHSATHSDDRSHRSLSRLYMSAGSQRRGKDRPSVPPSPSTIDNEARKRTISGPVGGMRSASPAGAFKPTANNTTGGMRNLSPNMPTSPASTGAPVLKPGERAVDQIGEPDYSGWMRKKGDRYNSWKLRYFVLKGPHLYYLRSRTVRFFMSLSQADC